MDKLRLEIIKSICFKQGITGHIEQFEAIERIIESAVIEARIDTLLDVGIIAHKVEDESHVAWHIANEIDEMRAELQAQLNKEVES